MQPDPYLITISPLEEKGNDTMAHHSELKDLKQTVAGIELVWTMILQLMYASIILTPNCKVRTHQITHFIFTHRQK